MKNQRNKQDLIEKVVEQIKEDVHCGDYTALEELMGFLPIENLIAYLPEEYWKNFKHLKLTLTEHYGTTA